MCSGSTDAVPPPSDGKLTHTVDYGRLDATRATWQKIADGGNPFLAPLARKKLQEMDAPTVAQIVPPPPAPSAVLAPQITAPKVGAADLVLPTIRIPRG